jgi:hypothetical protein
MMYSYNKYYYFEFELPEGTKRIVWNATLSNDASSGRFFVMIKIYHDE